MRFALVGLVAASLLTRHLATPPTLAACATAPMPGQVVEIADEEALIVHDPVAGVEHFIRRAAFRTAAAEFGFLVPTPTLPTMAEAPLALFDALAQRIAPRVETRTLRGFALTSCCLSPLLLARHSAVPSAVGVAIPPVEVLSTQRVAGFDATVLRAADPAELGRWLGAHGYADSPDLRAWVAPYIAQRWIVTAFRIARASPEDPRPPSTSNVRMTFATPQAVYPYREPARPLGGEMQPRRLRVHVITQGRTRGSLGREGGAFPGRVIHARPLGAAAGFLGGAVPAGAITAGAWLTTFDDTSSPRPGSDDVWFSRDPSQREIEPPPVVHVHDGRFPLPIDLVFMVMAGGAWWWRRRRARAR